MHCGCGDRYEKHIVDDTLHFFEYIHEHFFLQSEYKKEAIFSWQSFSDYAPPVLFREI
jgi:hypothetical protein